MWQDYHCRELGGGYCAQRSSNAHSRSRSSAHSTIGLGLNPDRLTETIHDVLTSAEIDLTQVIADTNIETLKLAPCNILLAGAELELTLVFGREFVLGEKLSQVSDQYDVCIIDCPPSLGMLTLNALVASTDIVVPVQVHYYAMEGLKQLLETVSIVRERFHPCSVKILGLLLTFVENRTILSKQIQQQMREFFGSLVFDTVVHRTVRLAEAPSAGESIVTYAPKSKGAAEYMALAAEIFNGTGHASQQAKEEIEVDDIQAEQAKEIDNGGQE